MNQVLLLPVSRDWSRGDPTQSSETQLWDFGENIKKEECLLELVTEGWREAHGVEGTC